MRIQRSIFACLFFAVLISYMDLDRCISNDELTEKVLAGWTRYSKKMESLKGTFTLFSVDSSESDGSTNEQRIQYEIKKLNGGNNILLVEPRRARVVNKRYLFELSRKEEKSDVWQIRDLRELKGVDIENPNDIAAQISKVVNVIVPPVGMIGINTALNSKEINFSLISSDSNRVKVAFSNTLGPEESGFERRLEQNGQLILDGANNYLPVAFDLKFNLIAENKTGLTCNGKCTGKIKYALNSEELVPTQYEITQDFQSLAMVISNTIDLELDVSYQPKQKEFELPAFGLPTPAFVKKSFGIGFYASMSVIGFVLIVTGYFLFRRKS